MSNKTQHSTAPSGAIKLHHRLWGKIFEYIDGDLYLDDLARVKAAGCMLVCCKTLKTILLAGGAELWHPLISSVLNVAQCVRYCVELPSEPETSEKPWLPLTALNTNCIHCRGQARYPQVVHPRLGVRICSRCCRQGFGLIYADRAREAYGLTDADLERLPHTTDAYYGPWKLYVLRQVKVAAARRFGTGRNLDAVLIIRFLQQVTWARADCIAAKIGRLYTITDCRELLDNLVRGKILKTMHYPGDDPTLGTPWNARYWDAKDHDGPHGGTLYALDTSSAIAYPQRGKALVLSPNAGGLLARREGAC